MNLVVDIGNSLLKAALFNKKNEIVFVNTFEVKSLITSIKVFTDFIDDISGRFSVQQAIVSSVVKDLEGIFDYLQKIYTQVIILDHSTPLPVQIHYKTPETLGKDRIAAAVGALYIFPENNCLVIDSGTCITYELITREGKYLGGNISPGPSLRFRAMNNFTSKLPLLNPDNDTVSKVFDKNELVGSNTEKALITGVFFGILYEIKGMIGAYKSKYPDLKVIITGGYTSLFERPLKNEIFADSNIVLKGLNEILKFNARKS